jgi:hypothetical protein
VPKLLVKQSDASFEAHFVAPAFALLSPLAPGLLHQNMLLGLKKYGLALNDVRVEAGIPNLAGANATYALNICNAFVRVWLNRLEVTFLDLTRVRDEGQRLEIAVAALNAVQHTVQDIQIETYTATFTMHGLLSDAEIAQFLAQHVPNVPEGIGMVVGKGVVYYLGPEAERRLASLVIDMSAVFSEALFVKVSAICDGTKLSLEHGFSAARDDVFKILTGIQLVPSWEV